MKPQKENKENGTEKNTFNKIIADFFYLMKYIDFYIQDMKRNPSRINVEKITPRTIMIKLLENNNKEKNLDSSRGKKRLIIHRGI